MTDSEITRMDFSFWLRQEVRKKGINPRSYFGQRWRELSMNRAHPNYADIVKISRITELPVEHVFKLAVGVEPILLDDAI